MAVAETRILRERKEFRTVNRLILLEGLPGTGKTANAYKLYEQLVRNYRDVRWLHEVSQPHPMLFFSESCLTKEE